MAQAELTRKKVENILSLMPAALCGFDEEGKITFFNRRALELWGASRKLSKDKTRLVDDRTAIWWARRRRPRDERSR
jgi:PAS domain-containing protein